MDEFENPFPEPIEIPLTDTLDLHHFHPQDVGELVDDWLKLCSEAGFDEVRIIHGRGTGAQRNRVHAILTRHHLVASFHLAPANPGATVVVLRGDIS